MKPLLIDAYCCSGGATKGYQRAGFRVVGVDIVDKPNYCGDEFHRGDAIEFIREHGHEAALIHTGPPCQGQIAITAGNRKRSGWTDSHVNLIPETRKALDSVATPYVIENGPSKHLRPDVVLCGLMFKLPTLRHRYFELGGWSAPQPDHVGPRNHRGQLTAGWRHGHVRTWEPSECPKCGEWHQATVYGVYGQGGGKPSVEEAQRALGIDWVHDIDDLNEAIPPAYTEFIGRAFLTEEQLALPGLDAA